MNRQFSIFGKDCKKIIILKENSLSKTHCFYFIYLTESQRIKLLLMSARYKKNDPILFISMLIVILQKNLLSRQKTKKNCRNCTILIL